MYIMNNPDLVPSEFINHVEYLSSQITKFRLVNHFLPIETGRWCRRPRYERFYTLCNVQADEQHIIYHCIDVDRSALELPGNLNDLWKSHSVFKLFERISRLKYVL